MIEQSYHQPLFINKSQGCCGTYSPQQPCVFKNNKLFFYGVGVIAVSGVIRIEGTACVACGVGNGMIAGR